MYLVTLNPIKLVFGVVKFSQDLRGAVKTLGWEEATIKALKEGELKAIDDAVVKSLSGVQTFWLLQRFSESELSLSAFESVTELIIPNSDLEGACGCGGVVAISE